jgi:hypothetical protein
VALHHDSPADEQPGVAFTIAMRGREVDQHLIRHEFIKRLQQRYRAEGIQLL